MIRKNSEPLKNREFATEPAPTELSYESGLRFGRFVCGAQQAGHVVDGPKAIRDARTRLKTMAKKLV